MGILRAAIDGGRRRARAAVASAAGDARPSNQQHRGRAVPQPRGAGRARAGDPRRRRPNGRLPPSEGRRRAERRRPARVRRRRRPGARPLGHAGAPSGATRGRGRPQHRRRGLARHPRDDRGAGRRRRRDELPTALERPPGCALEVAPTSRTDAGGGDRPDPASQPHRADQPDDSARRTASSRSPTSHRATRRPVWRGSTPSAKRGASSTSKTSTSRCSTGATTQALLARHRTRSRFVPLRPRHHRGRPPRARLVGTGSARLRRDPDSPQARRGAHASPTASSTSCASASSPSSPTA